jgi:hypothetical protein
MTAELFQQLACYPIQHWGIEESERWGLLSNTLVQYQAPSRSLLLQNSRKWELVSALQKSIRRADKHTAVRLVSAMASMPEEYAYFWRRLCVVACEDVGPADDTLAKFVVACSTLFARKRARSENHNIWCFLTEQMCDLPSRSRVYCSYGILDLAITRSELPELIGADKKIIRAILEQRTRIKTADDLWPAWQRKNDWRAEGLLRFVGMTLPAQLTCDETPLPTFKTIFDLPSYCYDKHTRVGLEMLRRLVRGVPGAEGLREFFTQHGVNGAHRAVGEALFFVEGARIQRELVYEPLCSLEQRFFAHQHRLPLNEWGRLRFLVQKALEEGVVDRVREEILNRHYGQGILQLIARTEEKTREATSDTTN